MQVIDYDLGVSHLTYDPSSSTNDTPKTPGLFVARDGSVEKIMLAPGTRLAFRLNHRHCAGEHDFSTHIPCAQDEAPFCTIHTDTWRCAQCIGNCELPLSSCKEEHAVYLAAFAPDTFKIGVTRHYRLIARLREQGADRGAHIFTVSNGRIARQIERDYAEWIPDRITIAQKIPSFANEINEEAWNSLIDDFTVLNSFDFSYGLELPRQPLQETMATGTIRGLKGRLLLLEHGNDIYVVDIRDLIGYEVESVATKREMQSSLGSFE